MTVKDYHNLADVVGGSFALAHERGGETARTHVYDEVYTPLVKALAADNPRFDEVRFAFATAGYEMAYIREMRAVVNA